MTLHRRRTFFMAAALGVALAAGPALAGQAREDILASAPGCALPRQPIETVIGCPEFLAGGAFSPEEKHAILEEARAEFVRDPVGDLKVYASIEQAAGRAAALKRDTVKETEFREDTIAAVHLDLLSKPAKDRDSAA